MPDEPTFDEIEADYAARLTEVTAAAAQQVRESLAALDSAPSMGGWAEPPRAPGAPPSPPAPQLSDEAAALLAAVNDLGVDIPFDWPHWSQGRVMAESPDNLGEATPAQAMMLINALQRFDRFSDGALLKAFEDRVFQAAVRRALIAVPV